MNIAQIIGVCILGGILLWASCELQDTDSDRKKVVSLLLMVPTAVLLVLYIGLSIEGNKKGIIPEVKKESYELVTDSLYRKRN